MERKNSLSAKERIRQIVDSQPDDSSFDAILHELAFARMIERGVDDADAGRVLPHADVIRETKSWRK